MLVLSRKRLEAIQIGPEIRITVVKVERGLVRLGIEAPENVVVLREELLLDDEEQAARDAWQAADPEATNGRRGA
jgi:carbon storage regulator